MSREPSGNMAWPVRSSQTGTLSLAHLDTGCTRQQPHLWALHCIIVMLHEATWNCDTRPISFTCKTTLYSETNTNNMKSANTCRCYPFTYMFTLQFIIPQHRQHWKIWTIEERLKRKPSAQHTEMTSSLKKLTFFSFADLCMLSP